VRVRVAPQAVLSCPLHPVGRPRWKRRRHNARNMIIALSIIIMRGLAHCRLQSVDCGLQTVDCRLWTTHWDWEWTPEDDDREKWGAELDQEEKCRHMRAPSAQLAPDASFCLFRPLLYINPYIYTAVSLSLSLSLSLSISLSSFWREGAPTRAPVVAHCCGAARASVCATPAPNSQEPGPEGRPRGQVSRVERL